MCFSKSPTFPTGPTNPGTPIGSGAPSAPALPPPSTTMNPPKSMDITKPVVEAVTAQYVKNAEAAKPTVVDNTGESAQQASYIKGKTQRRKSLATSGTSSMTGTNTANPQLTQRKTLLGQ